MAIPMPKAVRHKVSDLLTKHEIKWSKMTNITDSGGDCLRLAFSNKYTRVAEIAISWNPLGEVTSYSFQKWEESKNGNETDNQETSSETSRR